MDIDVTFLGLEDEGYLQFGALGSYEYRENYLTQLDSRQSKGLEVCVAVEKGIMEIQ